MTILKAAPVHSAAPPSQEAALSAAVAQRIGALRKKLGLSFDGLAQYAGVSKGTLVQIEQGGANPSISTLCRLAGALGVSVADLVSPVEEQKKAIVVIGLHDKRCLWSGPSGGSALLLAGTPGSDMLEIWAWVMMPGERVDASIHAVGTRELIHVTEGSLVVVIDGQDNVVTAGSTAIALTDRPHAYYNSGKVPVHFTMVVHEPPANR